MFMWYAIIKTWSRRIQCHETWTTTCKRIFNVLIHTDIHCKYLCKQPEAKRETCSCDLMTQIIKPAPPQMATTWLSMYPKLICMISHNIRFYKKKKFIILLNFGFNYKKYLHKIIRFLSKKIFLKKFLYRLC